LKWEIPNGIRVLLKRGVAMKTNKVILFGLGNIGQELARVLVKKKGVEIVGAVDIAKDKIGKDLGEVVGLGRQLSITVTNDADSLVDTTYADVVIHATSSRTLREIYPEIIKPVKQGINIITPCMETSDPYLYDPEIAAKIEKLTRENGVTFLGVGSTQLAARVVMVLIEACTDISKVKFTAHADVSKFSEESRQYEFGIGLTFEAYKKKVEGGHIKGHESIQREAALIAECLGWRLDEVRQRIEPIGGENGRIIGVIATFEGVKDSEVKVEYVYEFVVDPKPKYTHEVVVEGECGINAFISYTPDRGLTGTVAPLVHAIPYVVNAEPGIIKMLDLGICSLQSQ